MNDVRVVVTELRVVVNDVRVVVRELGVILNELRVFVSGLRVIIYEIRANESVMSNHVMNPLWVNEQGKISSREQSQNRDLTITWDFDRR